MKCREGETAIKRRHPKTIKEANKMTGKLLTHKCSQERKFPTEINKGKISYHK